MRLEAMTEEHKTQGCPLGLHEDVIMLKTKIATIEADMTVRLAAIEASQISMTADLREVRDIVITNKGGYSMLITLATISATVGGIIASYLPFLHIGTPK